MYTFYEPEFQPVFSLFGLPVYPYALFMAIGAAVALGMTLLRAKRSRLPAGAVLTFAMLGIPLAVIGGRVAFCLCSFVNVLDYGFGYIFRLDGGGFTVMGAAVGLLGAAALTRLIERVRVLAVLDAATPGLLVLLALARFAEGSTLNGIGPEITVSALQAAPLGRMGLYGDVCYAVNVGEALTALAAGACCQAMRTRPRGLTAGTGAIVAAAGQILWESARRDEVLTISFVRYVMVFSALVMLVILILSLHRLDWPAGGKALVIVLFFLGVTVCGLMEFLRDGKIIQTFPIWLCYLLDALTVTGMAVLCRRVLAEACDMQ